MPKKFLGSATTKYKVFIYIFFKFLFFGAVAVVLAYPILYRPCESLYGDSQAVADVRMTKALVATGVVFYHHWDVSQFPDFKRLQSYYEGTGAFVSIVDINGDGRPDLFFPSPRAFPQFG